MRTTLQKAPVLLAIFAWLMQLSVFITPVLMKHPELGFGVCEELAVVADQTQRHTLDSVHTQHATMSMPSTDSHDHTASNQHTVSHCKFCWVFGHNFDPLLIACVIALLSLLLAKISRPLVLYIFKLHLKLYRLLFQNRAPPHSAVFTPVVI